MEEDGEKIGKICVCVNELEKRRGEYDWLKASYGVMCRSMASR